VTVAIEGDVFGCSSAPATVLVVDDSPENLRVLSDMLQPEYRVLAANSGERALRIVRGELLPHLRSAPLHDIGKVGIPDGILRKPGPLSPEEWAVMKTHAKIGADAIALAERDAERPVAFLALAKEIARWHHERWDGTGYPDGLAGEAIPVSARIMAVADVFDALVSPRVYKRPMELDSALEVVEQERGRHFDPDVSDVLLGHRQVFGGIARRFEAPVHNPGMGFRQDPGGTKGER
jgi:response regulator RpfG family c-di-GMP phosphodiesterase